MHVHSLTCLMPSYITSFQFSPVSIWNIVMNAQKMLSNECLAWSLLPSFTRNSSATGSSVRLPGFHFCPLYLMHSPPTPSAPVNVTHCPTCDDSHGA